MELDVAKKYKKVLEDAGCIAVIESEFAFDDPISILQEPPEISVTSANNSVTTVSSLEEAVRSPLNKPSPQNKIIMMAALVVLVTAVIAFQFVDSPVIEDVSKKILRQIQPQQKAALSTGDGTSNSIKQNKPIPGITPIIDKNDAVAVVNGQYISKKTLNDLEKDLAERNKGESSAFPKEKLIDELVQREVLVQDAIQKKLDQTTEVAAQLEAARKAILTQASLQNYLKANPVTDADIKIEYESKVGGANATEYRASHILVKTEDEAIKLIVELDNGAKFNTLANKYSLDAKESQNGGDLGWFSPSQMVAPFSEAVAKLGKGKYTKTPVQTQFGWHVISLEDSRKQNPPTLEAVKEQLKPILQRQKIQIMVESLRKQAKVSILGKNASGIDKSDAIAIVNGQNISKKTLDDLEKDLAERNKGESSAFPKEKLIDELVQRELLVQDAIQKKLDQTTEVVAQLEAARKAILTQASLQDYLKANPTTDITQQKIIIQKMVANLRKQAKVEVFLPGISNTAPQTAESSQTNEKLDTKEFRLQEQLSRIEKTISTVGASTTFYASHPPQPGMLSGYFLGTLKNNSDNFEITLSEYGLIFNSAGSGYECGYYNELYVTLVCDNKSYDAVFPRGGSYGFRTEGKICDGDDSKKWDTTKSFMFSKQAINNPRTCRVIVHLQDSMGWNREKITWDFQFGTHYYW